MSEYFISVFAICACLGILGLISYDEKNTAERFAFGIILLYVVLSPIADVIGEIDAEDFSIEKYEASFNESGYSEVGEAALCEGIGKAIADEFSLREEDVSVFLRGFDFNEMRCESVEILLSGGAALSDSRAVKSFVEKMGVGKCEVEIEIGR